VVIKQCSCRYLCIVIQLIWMTVMFMLQALLIFWHQVCQDCPENVKLIVNSPVVTKNIAFNYIL